MRHALGQTSVHQAGGKLHVFFKHRLFQERSHWSRETEFVSEQLARQKPEK